ncbi:unnamed protein product [Orchesella dallaii]|uniref:Uncharacterized protein n=1 Tax=Orchesella dallaii TaxID=48710 RepID=A0ABP1RDI0_9HEXA
MPHHPIFISAQSFMDVKHYRALPLKTNTNNLSLQSYYRKLDTLDSTQAQRIPLTSDALPSILNLNEILTPFASPNCVVNPNNFRNIDFVGGNSPNYPLILWTPELGEVEDTWANMLSWMPKGFYKNGNVSWIGEDLHCNTSNLLRLYEWEFWTSGVCLGIDAFKFSSTSKPWNCQVEIHLYHPNTHDMLNYGYPEIIRANPAAYWENSFLHSFIYFRLPSVKIFVAHESLQYLDTDILSQWMHHVTLSHGDDRPINLLFLYAPVESISKQIGVIRSIKTMISRKKYYTKLNTTSMTNNFYRTHIYFQNSSLNNASLDSLSKLAYPDPMDIFHWHVDNKYRTYKLTESVNYQLSFCDKRLVSMKHFLRLPSNLSQMEKLAKTYAHVWLSIMKNASFTTALKSITPIVCYSLSGERKLEDGKYNSIKMNDDLFLNSTLTGRAIHIPIRNVGTEIC